MASYYCKYLNEVKSVVQELDPDKVVSINVSQNTFTQTSTSANLVFIHANYEFLPDTILKLENQGLPIIIQTIGIIKSVQNNLDNIFCEIDISIHKKFKKVIEKNPGYEIIIKINDILTGQGKCFRWFTRRQ
jgi:hypothetical protein